MINAKKFLGECCDYVYNPSLTREQRHDYSLTVKITAIALSILTFPIFIAISLIRGFFKSRAVDLFPNQNNFRVDMNDPRLILGNPSGTIEDRSTDFDARHPVTLEEQVEIFVARFLHPYITGHIRPVGEDIDPKLAALQGVIHESADRTPMIDLLHEKLEISDEDKARVDEIAVDAYLQIAAQGIYINKKNSQKINSAGIPLSYNIGDQDPDLPNDMKTILEAARKELVDAVLIAFRKDFPNYEITDEQLEARTIVALDKVNSLRTDHGNEESEALIKRMGLTVRG